ncbi:unnamed protein product [Adineta ricciae]|uniref:F-box domain-containing protein n=1 Tax=Adineta ricciae TaxID=249248 RepID=A0A816D1E9_ADIRI|nr:unnamed protein product [Adineta ricciae]
MECFYSDLLDLPSEILMIILMQLDTIDHIMLIGLNKRLNCLLFDLTITKHLRLFRYTSDGHICRLNDKYVNVLCLQILPQIDRNIESIYLEESLLRTFYSKCTILRELVATWLIQHRSVQNFLFIPCNDAVWMSDNALILLFTNIFRMFRNLQDLDFGFSSVGYQDLSFEMPHRTIYSPGSFKLHVNVKEFHDCLYLLDDCFHKLKSLHIQLINMKHFSLTCDKSTNCYYESIVPLLRRMVHLEKFPGYYGTVGSGRLGSSHLPTVSCKLRAGNGQELIGYFLCNSGRNPAARNLPELAGIGEDYAGIEKS